MKKTIKASIVIILALLFIGFLAYKKYYNKQDELPVSPSTETETKNPETIGPQARVDVIVPSNQNRHVLEVKLADLLLSAEESTQEVYAVHTDNQKMTFSVTPSKNTQILLQFKGPFEKDSADKFVEHWIKYTSVKVDGRVALSIPQTVWYNQPYDYTFMSKKGKTYVIEVEWKKL